MGGFLSLSRKQKNLENKTKKYFCSFTTSRKCSEKGGVRQNSNVKKEVNTFISKSFTILTVLSDFPDEKNLLVKFRETIISPADGDGNSEFCLL